MKSGKLFLVAGASGSGKSSIIAALAVTDSRFVMHRKSTTRETRGDSDTDVWHDPSLGNLAGNEDRVVYLTNGSVRYGISLQEVSADLDRGLNVLLVCVDHGVTEALRELLPGRVVVVFVHRDLTPEMERVIVTRDPKGGVKRLVARARMYDQLAAGLYRPDFVVLNVGKIQEAVKQFQLIVDAPFFTTLILPATNARGVLHIIVSPSGRLKDAIEEAGVWSYPGWGGSFIHKDVRGQKTERPEVEPGSVIRYSFFGKEYEIDPKVVVEKLDRYRVAFITVADIKSARYLQMLVKQVGFLAYLHYLHQEREEIEASVRSFPESEWKARFNQARDLLQQYQGELILEALPLLPVGGEEQVVAWVQKCIRERPR